ncbi:MAG: uracil-DNA glycosylase family protein [Roseobacter sp.]
MSDIIEAIATCQLCKDRFAQTHSGHAPRPVVWFSSQARILVAGQAPGMRVHQSGRPFTDPSGDRLQAWMNVDEDVFYDRSKIAIVPMAFCFPGYDAKGSDLPPPPICARTWHDRVMGNLTNRQLTLIIGAHAMAYHLGQKGRVTDAVRDWQNHGDDIFVLPHPSWRNTGWLNKNPWFAKDVLPRLQARIKDVLND